MVGVVLLVVIDGTPLLHLPERWAGLVFSSPPRRRRRRLLSILRHFLFLI